MKKYGIKYDLDLEKEITLKQTIKELDKIKKTDFQINKLVVDYYNKVVAILFKNGIYLPVKPSGIIVNYSLILQDEVEYLNYKTSIKLLEDLHTKTKIPSKPIYKILSTNQPIKIIT